MLVHILTFASIINAQGWAARMYGLLDDTIEGVTVDSDDNVFVVSSCQSQPITIYDSAGQAVGSLSNNGLSDVCVVKYASNGSYLWATRLGGTGNDYGQAIAADSLGNICVGGRYQASINIYNAQGGSSVKTLALSGTEASFAVKYSPNGTFIFAARLDGPGSDTVQGVAVDLSNNVLVTGYYQTSAMIIYDAQGAAVKTMTAPVVTASFLVKYLENGSFVWAARQDGNGLDAPYFVYVDPDENAYVAGEYRSTGTTFIIYDSLNRNVKSLTLSGASAGFVVKYASNGSFEWVARQDGVGGDKTSAVCTYLQGNVYIGGQYQTSAVSVFDALGNNVKSLTIGGTLSSYLVKYIQNGTFVWALRIGGSAADYAQSVFVDSIGNVVIGCFYTSISVLVYDQPGLLRATLPNSGQYGSIAVKYSSNGTFLWVTRQDGVMDDYVQGLAVDLQDNVYVAGYYGTGTLFIYDAQFVRVTSLSTSVNYVGFIVKYNSDGMFNVTSPVIRSTSTSTFTSTLQLIGTTASTTRTTSSLTIGTSTTIATSTVTSSTSSYISSTSSSTWLTGTTASTTVTRPSSQLTSTTTSASLSGTTVVLPSMTLVDSVASSPSTISSSITHVTTLAISSTVNSSLRSAIVSSFTMSSSTGTSTSSTTGVSSNTRFSIYESIPATMTTSAIYQQTQIGTSSPLTVTSDPTINLQYTFFEQTSNSLPTQSIISANVVDSQSPFNSLVLYLILGAIVALALTVTIIACYLRFRKRILRVNTPLEPEPTEMVHSSNMTATNTTAMVTSHVLAAPQFMVLQFGVDFRQLDEIARGGGGAIYHCKVLDSDKFSNYDGSKLVIKNLGDNVQNLADRLRESFYQELSILYMFRDQTPFAKMYGFTEQPSTILLKLYELGSLKQFLLGENQSSSKFLYSKRQVLSLSVDLTRGLMFMHSKQFVHCDVKPDNVLLENVKGKLEPRITDFGISRVLDQSASLVKAFTLSQVKGASISYAGPEVVLRYRNRFNESNPDVWKAGDVFAFSIALYEILNRKKVWN